MFLNTTNEGGIQRMEQSVCKHNTGNAAKASRSMLQPLCVQQALHTHIPSARCGKVRGHLY